MYVKEKAGGSSVARMSYPMDPEKVLQQTAWIAPALPQVSQFTQHRLGCSPLNSWPRNPPHTRHVSPSHTEPWAPRVPSAKEKPSFPIHTKQMIDSDHFSPRKKYFHTFPSFPTLLLYCRVFTPRKPPEIPATQSHIGQVPPMWRICQIRRCKSHGFDLWVRKTPGVGMPTHSSLLAWKIPWTEEPGGLQSMGSQRVGHDWATEHAHTSYM